MISLRSNPHLTINDHIPNHKIIGADEQQQSVLNLSGTIQI